MTDKKGVIPNVLERKIRSLQWHEEEQRTSELARKFKHPYKNIVGIPIEAEALLMIPEKLARAAHAAAIRKSGKKLTVAVMNPLAPPLSEALAAVTALKLEPELVIVSKSGLEYAWSHYQRYLHLLKRITGEIELSHERIEEIRTTIQHVEQLKKLLESASPSDAASLVEILLGGALKLDASDIHIEPQPDNARLRYRLDGVLHDLGLLIPRAYALLLSRIKLLSGLKLNVQDTGQDGRFTIFEEGVEIEVRSSTLPGPHGEYVVMRLLHPESLISLIDLGMRRDLIDVIEAELKEPNGMILTTGPTGSGKTTALYAFLQRIMNPETKIITIEDPIEYRIPGLEQTQVDPEAGYDFANGLRSIVRQDPDVILVGEIRDRETAEIAIHASLTGHLVFSTLHTNDAAGAVPRLIDLTVNPTVIAPAMNVIMAQRLVRRACKRCAELQPLTSEERKKVEAALTHLPPNFPKPSIDAATAFSKPGKGCGDCHFTGYRGRIGIFELFQVLPDLEEMILANPSVELLRKTAIAHGMVTMQLDALLRAFDGITTIEEIERVTGPLEEAHQ